uniref:Uncharacterized protein n=1 Tax=Aegilops tauschii subsp. strangulata TaxID=200361 RepID=A0A453CE42_AEGTS
SGPPRRRGAAPTPPRGLGADGVRGARLLRLRRLPRRQRQQQLPHDHGARRRAALRHRLPHAHAHGEVLQRPQHTRHHQRVPRGRARAAVPEPLHARREPARRRQLRVRRRRHPQRHRRAIREHHQDRTAAAELPGLPAEAGGVHRRGRGEGAREPVAGAHHARRQRLRQQLLPGALLRQVPAVRDPRLRPLHHLRVQESPLQRLYELGARRVIVTGTGMIGCVPAELALHSLDGSCAPDLTRAADLFNPQLERMGSRRPRSRAAGRARTTGSGCARRRPTCAPTGTCTPTGTPSTPRSGPTVSSSPTSCTAPPTTSAP